MSSCVIEKILFALAFEPKLLSDVYTRTLAFESLVWNNPGWNLAHYQMLCVTSCTYFSLNGGWS